MNLSDKDLLRYGRQIFLKEVDIEGQELLSKAHVVVMGVGGLGSLSSAYLAGAGIGKLTLVDDDSVEVSNLHRQLLYTENDIGKEKVVAAKRRLLESNTSCQIEVVNHRLNEEGLVKLYSEASLVIDGTDNFASRFLINRACVKSSTTLVSAAITMFSGQMSTFDYAENSPCYACLFSEDGMLQAEENSCADNGVLGPAVGVMASYQALHALKYLLGLEVESLNKLSDIHIHSGLPVKVRIDGSVIEMSGKLIFEETQLLSMMKGVVSPDIFNQFIESNQFDSSFSVPNGPRVRINMYRQLNKSAVVMRIINSEIQTRQQLNLPLQIDQVSKLRRGLVVFSGATGSGKSTSMAAIIDEINRTRQSHILTIEDPVEYIYQPDKCVISQREIGSDVVDFKQAFKSALREDPDVILMGEMRDYESINFALELADTGHLVLLS